jgi:hypothetical protein
MLTSAQARLHLRRVVCARRQAAVAMQCLQAAPHAPHALRPRRGVAPAAAAPCRRPRRNAAAAVTAASAVTALPPLSPAGAAAKAALLARVATAPDRGVFGLPARAQKQKAVVAFRARTPKLTRSVRCRAARPGAQESERAAVEALLRALEAHSPLAAPTSALQFVEGEWRLLYTTVRQRSLRVRAAAYGTRCRCR